MRKNILQQVADREETYTVTVVDAPETVDAETGDVIPAVTHTETRTRTVPVMAAVTVDMTPEEEAALLADAPAPEPEPPDLEQRVATVETTAAELSEAVELILSGVTE